MYEALKRLVEENKLSFADEHQTNARYLFENKKEWFLEKAQYNCSLYEFYTKKFPIFSDEECSKCGEHIRYYLKGEQLVPYHLAGLQLAPTDVNCVHEKEVVVEIPVPSGELIFADWIKYSEEFVRHLDEKTNPIFSPKMKIRRVRDYAKEGFAHFFVGNTSPTVFQKENKILIGHNSYDDNDNEILLDKDATDRGMVVTDLWWVSICDRMIYEKLAIEKFGEEKGKEMTEAAVNDAKESHVFLQVTPGVYQLRYFTELNDDTDLHAILEKITKLTKM